MNTIRINMKRKQTTSSVRHVTYDTQMQNNAALISHNIRVARFQRDNQFAFTKRNNGWIIHTLLRNIENAFISVRAETRSEPIT